MSKRRSPGSKQKSPRHRNYDTQMIGDFLQHLLWECRIATFEHTAAVGTINPELVEQLEPFIEKYGPTQLVRQNAVHLGGATVAEGEQAVEVLRTRLRARYTEATEHLEALDEIFSEALALANHSQARGFLILSHEAANLLKDAA
jgi:hypothetical protein